jgi:hypothetical protein
MKDAAKRAVLFSAAAGLALFSAPLAAQTYFVSPAGDDGNPGTEAEPWLTIQHAADVAAAGDTVMIMEGTYTESGNTNRAMITPASSGEPGNLVTYRANPGDHVVIDGGGERSFAFELNGLDYIRIEGLEITGTTAHGILVSWESEHGFGIEIMGNDIHDCGVGSPDSAAVYYRYARGGLIEDNTLHHNGGDGITMDVTDGIVVRGNAIFENAVDGIKGGGSGTIIIENNAIHDMTSGEHHGDCIQYMGNEAVIRGNVFYNCTQDVYIDTYSDPAGASPRGDFYIYNNVIYNPDPGPDGTEGFYNGISIDQRYNTINALYVFNNTIVNQNSGHGGFGNGSADDYRIGTLVVMNNIFLNSVNGIDFEAADTVEMDYNLYWNEFRDWYLPGFVAFDEFRTAFPDYEAHGMAADPLLALELTSTNPITDPDFTLQESSPAVDAGVDLAAYFTTDIIGMVRPQGAAWDMGAYEYSAPVITDPVADEPADALEEAAPESPDPLPDTSTDGGLDDGTGDEGDGSGGGDEGCGCAVVR